MISYHFHILRKDWYSFGDVVPYAVATCPASLPLSSLSKNSFPHPNREHVAETTLRQSCPFGAWNLDHCGIKTESLRFLGEIGQGGENLRKQVIKSFIKRKHQNFLEKKTNRETRQTLPEKVPGLDVSSSALIPATSRQARRENLPFSVSNGKESACISRRKTKFTSYASYGSCKVSRLKHSPALALLRMPGLAE